VPRGFVCLFLLLPCLAACSIVSDDAARIDGCERGFLEGAQAAAGTPPQVSAGQRRKLHRACKELVSNGLDDSSDSDDVLAFLRKHPDVTADVCDVGSSGAYEAMVAHGGPPMNGYLKREDVVWMTRQGCRYGILEGYGSLEEGFDYKRVFEVHPDLAVPLCAAPLMQGYDEGGTRRPSRRRFAEVADHVCLDAIRTGVVDYSSGNLYNPTIDAPRFREMLVAAIAAEKA
jgi:hypothetical protein